MALSMKLRVRKDLEISGKLLPAGTYESVHIPPFSGSGIEPPHDGTWRLLSPHGVFDVGQYLKSGEVVPEFD